MSLTTCWPGRWSRPEPSVSRCRGIHEVIVNTGTQIITLKHEAQDRSLFAEGALAAAAFLLGRAPGLYDMNDIVAQEERTDTL